MMMFTELGFLLALIIFRNIPAAGHSIFLFLLGINIAMMATFLINLFQKTSFHTTGIGGLLGAAIGLMYYTRLNMTYWIVAISLLCLLSGMARFRLKAHTSFEIYLGYTVGILSLCLVFILGAKRF
jgi:hypothetical protein